MGIATSFQIYPVKSTLAMSAELPTYCIPGQLESVGAVGEVISVTKSCLTIGAIGNSYTLDPDGSVSFSEPVDSHGKTPPSAYFPITVSTPGVYGVHLTVRGYDSGSDSFLIQLFDPEGKELLFPGPVASANMADVRFNNADIVSGDNPYFNFTTIRCNHWQVYDGRPKQFIPMVTWRLSSPGIYTLRVMKRENRAAFKNVRLVNNTIDPFVRERTWEKPISSIADIKEEADQVLGGNLNEIIGIIDDERAQELLKRAEEIMRKIRALEAELAVFQSVIKDFIAYGTPSTQKLGSGERAEVVASFQESFNKLPETNKDWEDIIKIANGRWPSQYNAVKEQQAESRFRKIYRRAADCRCRNKHDDAAIIIMAYGLRPTNRNLKNEEAAIKTFSTIYRRLPTSTTDWDTIRAIAYSGAKR